MLFIDPLRLSILSLQQPHFSILSEASKADSTISRRPQDVCASPFRNISVVATRIYAQDATDVVSITWHTELTEGISPLVEESSDRFADLVLAVLGMMTGTADGVYWSARCRMV